MLPRSHDFSQYAPPVDRPSLSEDIMPDFLHLSEKGYEIWAQAIEPKVAELMGDKPVQ